MQAVSIGHAGLLVRINDLTIACDPWFVPAFHGSWFVFPRNDQLSPELMHEVCNPDYLYISHLHGDHFDASFLAERMNKNTTVILPDYPTREMEREFNKLGFKKFHRTIDGKAMQLENNVHVAVHVETSITDGPGGDSAIVVWNDDARLVNQNDCRTNDLSALRSHGPVDLHWLQFSGAIWYPMAYEMDAATKLQLCRDKVESQFARAIRYVEALDATIVVPSAGPPCFLDDDLFSLNVITGDEPSIFPDQREFQKRLSDVGRNNVATTIPGTTFTVVNGAVTVEQPCTGDDLARIFAEKESYLRTYQADWARWLAELKRSWVKDETDLVATLKLWWEPLLAMAPHVREGIGANCLLNAGDLPIYIDFVNGKVHRHEGEEYAFRFDIERSLVETVVAERAVDWSNSLFLSCRFTAWRAGDYNENLYNFFKSLSVERMNRTEAEARDKAKGILTDEVDIEVGGYLVQRRCPHRNADLSVFGEVDGNDFVCTLHGWRFDLETGQCRTTTDAKIRIRKRNS